jgi:signal transduction histidine kinase
LATIAANAGLLNAHSTAILVAAALVVYAATVALMALANRRGVDALVERRLESERRLLEAQTAKQAVEAEKAAQLRALADMSHELRTPLNAIIGFADMIGSEIFGPVGSPRYSEYIADIKACGVHLVDVTGGILEITKAEAGAQVIDISDVDLNALVDQVCRMLRPEAEKNRVQLAVDVGRLPVLRTDETKLRQVLINLTSNAIKFTPANGSVTLKGAVASDRVALSVVDTGIGMAPDDIPKALMPFGQVDLSAARRNRGTGLGLPLANRFAELLGGSLAIDSALGKGTTVTVTLPLRRPA